VAGHGTPFDSRPSFYVWGDKLINLALNPLQIAIYNCVLVARQVSVKMTEKLRLQRVTRATAGNDVNYVTANQSVRNPLLRQLLGLRRPYPRQGQVNFTFMQGYECLSDMCTVFRSFKSLHFCHRSGGLKIYLRPNDSAGLASDTARNLTDGSPTGLDPDSMWTEVLRHSSESSAHTNEQCGW